MRALAISTSYACGALGLLAAGTALAQEVPFKDVAMPAPAGEIAPAGAETLTTGVQRSTYTARVPNSNSGPRMSGKPSFATDSQTGEMLVPTTRYFLPEGWNWGGGLAGVDSMGQPIVNQPLGWVGWTQADVDALRTAISNYLPQAAESQEGAGVVGNFIGQAVVRGIEIPDVDLTALPSDAAGAVLERMHAYEQARFDAAAASGVAYEPSTYPERIQQFVAAQGVSPADILAIDEVETGGINARSAPSGCYFRQPGSGYGLNLLVNSTTIWEADGTDDAQADVPIGFGFEFYRCADADINTAVRVSSNGYIAFFQQGGGALNGTEFINVPIGDSTSPNGMIAGYWDDMTIINQSNFPDRVSWKIEGSTGYRTLTIEYFSVSRLGGDATDYHTFQIVLHEHSVDYPNYSPIVLAYGAPGTYWQADSVDLATVGMESFNGTDGECLDTCDLLTNLPPSNFIFYPLNNDLCEDATPLTPDALQSGDLRFAHNTASTCNTTNADRWFRFYAPCSGTLTVDTCGTNDVGGTDQGIDTILSATSSCPGGGGIVLACDDDGGTACGDQGVVRDSRLVLNVQGGSTVYIRVSSFAPITTRGYFRLNSSFTSGGGRPANDDCAQAQPIGPTDSVSGNLLCATIDGSDDFGFPGRDVWYRFDHTLAGTLRVTTCGTHDLFGIDTGIDTVLSVHGGCPGSAQNQIAVNDDAPFSVCGAADHAFEFDSLVYAPLQAGQTAQIRVRPLGDNPRTGDYRVQTFFLVGDLDGDCDVDLQDLAFLLSHFGQSGPGLTGDIDGDNNVSLQDLAHVLSNFGFGCP